MLDVSLQLDRRGTGPLYRQLAEYLRGLIQSGRLARGEKLPATRELARALGIGRNTAAQAYQILIDDGALLAHVGQGTFVSSRGAAGTPEPEDQATGPRAFAWEGLLSNAGRQPSAAGLLDSSGDEIRYDFRGGRVDLDTLPGAPLRRAYAKAISTALPEIANGGHPFGNRVLREQIAGALLSRGIECDADSVLVTAGAQQALDLVARVLVDPGDRVAIEDPGYPIAALAFRSAGARLVGVRVDDEGLRTDELARILRSHRIKLIYTTPAAQLPTGVVLGDKRRRALLELADETQTPVLEDDYDSEFRYGPGAQAALKTLDRAGQVVYVGTFSKALLPGLRLGYVVAARPLRARLAMAQLQSTLGVDTIGQAAVAELLASGDFERHVRRQRRHYARRRAALIAALGASMPKGTRWTEPGGGLQLWLTLPAGVQTEDLLPEARAQGIGFAPGAFFHLGAGGEGQLALSFASQAPERIAEGVALLGKLVEGRMRRRAHPSRRLGREESEVMS